MQDQAACFFWVVGAQCAANGRRDTAAHGTCRQHLLQHDQGKHQGHTGQGQDAQFADIPSFCNADQCGGRHGQHIGQRQAPDGGRNRRRSERVWQSGRLISGV